MPVEYRDIIRRLRDEGWYLDRQRGTSHGQWKHAGKPGREVTVAGKPNQDVPLKTYKSICDQAGWSE